MTYPLAVDLLGRLGSEELFFTATTSQLKAQMGIDSKLFDRSYRDEVLEQSKRELDFVKDNNIGLYYFTDEEKYPFRLAECDDAPAMLYGLGESHLNDAHVISIVGTRHATMYGIGFVKELLAALSQTCPDIVVVSGLAYGIDVAAHRESLSHKIPTVGVLAHGLSTIYPQAHRNIAANMVRENGMLITDYRHTDKVSKWNFLARNRIVAGLADCTLVVESAEKGGAMVTARIASEYNRDVFALPGRNTDVYSRGCNRLISQNHACLIQTPDDILDFMNWEKKEVTEKESEIFYRPTPDEKKILDFLTDKGEGFVNRISVETGIPMHRLMGMLVDMEFKGLIVNYPGGIYKPGNIK